MALSPFFLCEGLHMEFILTITYIFQMNAFFIVTQLTSEKHHKSTENLTDCEDSSYVACMPREEWGEHLCAIACTV